MLTRLVEESNKLNATFNELRLKAEKEKEDANAIKREAKEKEELLKDGINSCIQKLDTLISRYL